MAIVYDWYAVRHGPHHCQRALETASGRRQVDERRAAYATHLSPDAVILRHVTGCEGGAGK